MRHGVLFYFLIFFVGISLVGGSVFNTYSQFVAEGPLPQRTEIVIPKGVSVKQVGSLLKEQGIIESPSIFVLGVRASGNTQKIKAGEYSIPPRSSTKMVMEIITGGKTYVRRLLIPEGLTSYQIVELLKQTPTLTGDIERLPRNGTLLPETYHYSYGDTRQCIIDRMQNAMKRTLDELWPTRAEGLPLKTPEEAIILASVVEKETSLDKERARIASVFYNRMAKKMRLQSDPTVIFGLTDGTGILKRSLTYKDLRQSNAYNTYVVYGLPAGAISNPGRASIQAVLNPIKSNDLYFVADGTGGHVFATNYKDHQNNVNRWRQLKKNKVALRQARQQPKASTIPIPYKIPAALAASASKTEVKEPIVSGAELVTPEN